VNSFFVWGIILAKKHPALYKFWRKLRKSEAGVISTPDTDICIEGFEASANSYTLNIIRHLRPDLTISHHCHAVANIKLALRYGVPAVVLFRHPKDAIASLAARFRPGLHEGAVAYANFYDAVHSLSDKVVLVSFEEVTQNLEYMLRKVEHLTGIKLRGYGSIESLDQEVKAHIREWKSKSEDPTTTPLPTSDRREKKHQLQKKLMNMDEYRLGYQAYERICANYEEQQNHVRQRLTDHQ